MSAIDRLFAPQVSSYDLEVGAQALGRLASWLLTDDALAKLASDPHTRQLVSSNELLTGEFLVLFERKDESAVLADGFALPLMWRSSLVRDTVTDEDPADEARLPVELRNLAKKARERARFTSDSARIELVDQMKLCLGRGCPDLSGFKVACRSAAAAIEASLRCSLNGYSPCRTVAVSAEIGPYGLGSVGGLRVKREAARRHGIETLVVAPKQDLSELEVMDAPPRIQEIRQERLDQQLGDIAALLDAPPYNGSLEERFRWFRRSNTNRQDERVNFFATQLAPEIMKHLRVRFKPDPIDTLVISDTLSHPEMALLLPELHGARKIVVVRVTASDTKDASPVIHVLQRHVQSVDVIPVPWDRTRSIDENEHELERLVRSDERVGIDLTMGPKDLAIRLASWHRRRYLQASTARCGRCTYIQYSPKGESIDIATYQILDLTDR